jgi:hypothetical protein
MTSSSKCRSEKARYQQKTLQSNLIGCSLELMTPFLLSRKLSYLIAYEHLSTLRTLGLTQLAPPKVMYPAKTQPIHPAQVDTDNTCKKPASRYFSDLQPASANFGAIKSPDTSNQIIT